ncbi:hypothetical protein RD792_017601 [Penstemon davidsonii]|uniref:Uncharacterized protein n=1 Tax=Penstemon davidsonii TaxID=160366 RepID=A0ABR0CMQ8_9LAMI|nr:hypothetical protein RD792_017601 [Penstemon davidsonii]
MLCACSGEQFKFEETAPQSPESLATRDFSASGISSRTGTVDWESKLEDAQVDEAESTLKEALSLNYEEARALLGRLEYQRGNFDAALQVFQGIDIRILSPRMAKAITERTGPRKLRSKRRSVLVGVMSLHSVSLLLEAILLKAKSLAELGQVKEAAKECNFILDTVESALPNGIHGEINEDNKLLEMFHRALELLPKLWIQSGSLDEAIAAYRRALVRPWNLNPQRLAKIQKDLATTLLYGGIETSIHSQFSKFPRNSTEESILLLFILMQKILYNEIEWDQEVMDHLTFSLTISGQFESLANHVEQVLPSIYNRAERWYFLALCYSAAGQNQAALDLLKKVSGFSEAKHKPHLASFLLGAKLCAQDRMKSSEGINFARRVIDICIEKDEHILSRAHKFLGVCYGNMAKISISDFDRVNLHRDSIKSLHHASGSEDPEMDFYIGLEHAIERNLSSAFDKAMRFSKITAGNSAKGWKLLALVASAEKRLKDAEAIVDLALDETGGIDQLELLRLKAVIQIAQEQPKQAIETYRILLSLIQGAGEHHKKHEKNTNEVLAERRLEVEAWLDLAGLYSNHESWLDSYICIDKAKATNFYSPRGWHMTGKVFEAQGQHKEAIVSFSVSLSIDPDYVPSIVSTAEVLMMMDHKSAPIAKSFLMNALRLEPMNHNAWLNLGFVYKMEGSIQQAADSFQAAHELKLSAPVQSFESL